MRSNVINITLSEDLCVFRCPYCSDAIILKDRTHGKKKIYCGSCPGECEIDFHTKKIKGIKEAYYMQLGGDKHDRTTIF